MTPTPWKVLDMADYPELSSRDRWATVTGPDGAVIITRMNRVDARHLVHCVNATAIRMRHAPGPKLGPIIHEGGTQ